jgi:hypothetical protein
MKNQEMMNILLELKTLVDLQTYLLTKIKSDVEEPEDNIIESDTENIINEIEFHTILENINNNDDNIEVKKIHLSKTKDYVKEYNKKRYAEQKNRKVICPYCQLEISYYMKNHHIKQKHKVEHIV